MNIAAQIIDQRVRKLADDHAERIRRQDPTTAGSEQQRVSKAFVALCVQAHRGLSLGEAFDTLTDGGGDLGIDALYRGDVRDGEFRVVLFQGKYRADLDTTKGFPANEIGKIIHAIRCLFDPARGYQANRLLTARVEEIRSLIRDGHLPCVQVVLCNNGQRWSREADREIEAEGFPRDQVLPFEHLDHEGLIQLLAATRRVDDDLRFSGSAVVEAFDFRRVLVGKVAVTEVADLFRRHGPRLLERNVRRFLGLANRVNHQIADTLRLPERRPDFYFFNNGVTLVCEKFQYNALQGSDFVVRIKDLQVVNGGQTCATIDQVLQSLPADDFSKTFVLVRLYEIDHGRDGNVVEQITLATNSQSPVELRDLRANDPIQVQLEEGLRDLGYIYERKRGGDDTDPRVITAPEAAEAVLTVWRELPHVARFQRESLFERYYARIFTPDLAPAQVALAVEVMRRVERLTEEAPEAVSVGAPFLPYAQHFLARQLGRHLLDREGLALGQVSHLTLARLTDRLMAEGQTLFHIAVIEIAMALYLLGIVHTDRRAVSLQRLSATFRRGDLLELLPRVREAAQTGLEALGDLNRRVADLAVAGRQEEATALIQNHFDAQPDDLSPAVAMLTAILRHLDELLPRT
jgi:hypothetical protein